MPRRACAGLPEVTQLNKPKGESLVKKLTVILALAMLSFAHAVVTYGTPGPMARVALAQASDVFTHTEAGVQFRVPKGWKAKPDGEVITVSSADDGLQVVFWVPDENTFDAAVKE